MAHLFCVENGKLKIENARVLQIAVCKPDNLFPSIFYHIIIRFARNFPIDFPNPNDIMKTENDASADAAAPPGPEPADGDFHE